MLVLDNLSTGFAPISTTRRRRTVLDGRGDLLLDADRLPELVAGASRRAPRRQRRRAVRVGRPARDLEQNVVATQNVLEAMRCAGVRRLLFSSTGSVYGEAEVVPTPEDAPFPVQTSLYGAVEGRRRGLHRRLRRSRARLGDGVPVRVDARAALLARSRDRLRAPAAADPAHLASSATARSARATCTRTTACRAWSPRRRASRSSRCSTSASTTTARSPTPPRGSATRLGVTRRLAYTGGDRGWIGDNPFIYLDTARIRATGWEPAFTHPRRRREHRRLPPRRTAGS